MQKRPSDPDTQILFSALLFKDITLLSISLCAPLAVLSALLDAHPSSSVVGVTINVISGTERACGELAKTTLSHTKWLKTGT